MGIPTSRTIAREAVGVVGAITPWNFPHQINLAKIGPALAAGNTVVLKPAPDTPWCRGRAGRLIAEHTDIPAGVVNVVTSSDHGVGALLSTDPRVDMVSFTGSTATGRAVMAAAAATLKKVFLELGGKSAFIVLDDADLAGACAIAAFTACDPRRPGLRDHHPAAGARASATTRPSRPRPATMAAIGAGDPTDPGTVCGPVISARQRDRVEAYLDLAIEEGGTFATGGGSRRRPADRASSSSRPSSRDWTTTPGSPARRSSGRCWRSSRTTATTTRSGSPTTRRTACRARSFGADPERAQASPRGSAPARVNVNGGVWYAADAPFGGYKQSGIGREMGVAGFEEYLEIKLIATMRVITAAECGVLTRSRPKCVQ